MNLNFNEDRIYRFFIAIELFCTGALLLKDVGGRMAGMLDMKVPLMNGIHILFVLLFIGLSLVSLKNPENGAPGPAEPASEKGGESSRLETHYYHITIVLALTAIVSIMEPNLIGFLISLIEYVFFGLPLRLGIKFFHMDIPLIVRISLCIADGAVALTLFCLAFHYITGAMFKYRPTVVNRPADDDPEDTPPQGS
ncbi:MAG: hypothetical protein K5770_08000 [Lachnospiraceae bacterium]|nr:hypothetical protein [Lachnospiraceae bacterium]